MHENNHIMRIGHKQKKRITRPDENAFGSKHITRLVRNNTNDSTHEFINLCCSEMAVKMRISTQSLDRKMYKTSRRWSRSEISEMHSWSNTVK